MTTTADRAATFRALHRPGAPLVLVNAWDAASACVFAEAGAPAIATSSAALAWSLGYADGQHLPLPLLVETVARIVRVVDVPVSVDLEAGYGATPDAVCAAVRQVVDAGGIGINIEDGDGDPTVLAAKIAAIRALELPLFVNARCDVFLRGLGAPEGRLAEAERRGRQYAAAGADGIFVPALLDLDAVAHLARALPRPLNVLAWSGAPSVPDFAAAGVARVSVGCSPMQATLGLARRMAKELLGAGTYAAMGDGLSVGEVNGLFAR
ncbi:MAG TPA: isocitrate lyase/phosphoenolpyruvate mutase family protein [Candidatus Binatia bacterium]|jgi:2-methylisocitrate lyase-like PEP mutase family enzyme|nr:isocitrate lyase/phosphoenolpyruvate mutase family protein [Candidatus Binatia bacterium]